MMRILAINSTFLAIIACLLAINSAILHTLVKIGYYAARFGY